MMIAPSSHVSSKGLTGPLYTSLIAAEACSAANVTFGMSAEEAPGSLIPVIDISRIDEGTGELAVAAAAQYGFLFVNGDNLGFGKEMIDHAFSIVRLIQACGIPVSADIAV